LLVVLVGGGFFWWQDQASLRGKEPSGLNLEHVEVESADGTTQIHPLDEPEDQAVTDSQTPTSAPLPLNTNSPTVEAPTVSTTAPATAPATATHNAPASVSTPSQVATAVPAPSPVTSESSVQPVVAGAGQLKIAFTADCWTQVTDAGGKVLYSGLKRKGDSLDLSGKPPLSVRLGAAAGAQVSYNGASVDVAPFTSGATARLKLGQ